MKISRRLTILYILALTAVAFLTIVGQLLVQRSIRDQQHDSKVVNYTGRQRFQSQTMVKSILLLTDTGYLARLEKLKTNKEFHLAQLKKFHFNWIKFNNTLQSGYWQDFNAYINKSDTLDSMIKNLQVDFSVTNENITKLIPLIEQGKTRNDKEVKDCIAELLKHENLFLLQMDKIVFQFDYEAKQRVEELSRIEKILMLATLFILLLEGIFIFRPAVNQIRVTIDKLIESEHRTNAMNDDLKQMNESLKKAEADLVEATQQKYKQQIHEQKVRSVSLIQGQESERKRIAQELHDGIGQMLTAIKINSDRISNASDLSEKNKKSLEDLKNLIGDTLAEVKNISFNLMPSVLNDFGIAPALKIMTERVSNNTHIQISFTTDVIKERLDRSLEVGIYRIAQEAINNAVKYAEATEIKLDLSEKSGYVFLNISDNGKGFNRRSISSNQKKDKQFSHGLNSMEERTLMFDGEIRIVSSIGKGTKIYVKLPSKHQEEV